MKVLAPNSTQIIERCKTLLEGINFAANPETDDPVAPLYKVYPEWIESFDNGENPDALRNPLDPFTMKIEGVEVEVGKVNCWLIDELSMTSETIIEKSNIPGRAANSKVRTTRLLRLFYFYQYQGSGVQYVRRVIDLARAEFRKPFLGFSEPTTNFIESVSDLQVPLISEGDFSGIIAYIRGCQLRVTTIEPR